jgi:hypothetical protein
MNPSNAALLAAATLFGLFVLAQSESARASAISLRGRHGKHPPTVVAVAGAAPSCFTPSSPSAPAQVLVQP